MPLHLFEGIYNLLLNKSIFSLRKDTTRKAGIHRMILIIMALPILVCSMAYDQKDEFCELTTSKSSESWLAVVGQCAAKFGDQYLRSSTESDF